MNPFAFTALAFVALCLVIDNIRLRGRLERLIRGRK